MPVATALLVAAALWAIVILALYTGRYPGPIVFLVLLLWPFTALMGLSVGRKKQPWLAVLLNTLPVGFGYLYLLRLVRFGMALLGGTAAVMGGLLIYYLLTFSYYATCSPCEIYVEFLAGGVGALPGLLVAGFTAWDAWRLALAHNAALGSPQQGTPGRDGGAI